MVWCSGWRLASAVSNAGGLGLIGAGSMHPEVLREHIRKCEAATDKPFGVNVPLMYPEIDTLMRILVEEKVKIVFTSAGNPKTWTKYLKDHDMTVVHVVSSSKFATKCEEAGVDAIVAEGFEAGGHNGREETTTMCLIPAVRKAKVGLRGILFRGEYECLDPVPRSPLHDPGAGFVADHQHHPGRDLPPLAGRGDGLEVRAAAAGKDRKASHGLSGLRHPRCP